MTVFVDNSNIPVPVLPEELYNYLYDGNTAAARKCFYKLLKSKNTKEILELKKNIAMLIERFKINLIPADVFSLRAIHAELIEDLNNLNDQDKINLLLNNQWLTTFYKNTNDVASLYSNMRNTGLAILGMKKQNDYQITILCAAFSILIAVFSSLLEANVVTDLMGRGLVGTQIACVGVALLFLFSSQKAYHRYGEYKKSLYDQFLSNSLSLDADGEKFTQSETSLSDIFSTCLEELKNSMDDSVGSYAQKINSKRIIDKYIGQNGLLHRYKETDELSYNEIFKKMNNLEIAYTYKDESQISDNLASGYLSMSMGLSSIVAISIALTHTNDHGLIFAGVLGCLALHVLLSGGIFLMANDEYSQTEVSIAMCELEKVSNVLANNIGRIPMPPYQQPYKGLESTLVNQYDSQVQKNAHQHQMTDSGRKYNQPVVIL